MSVKLVVLIHPKEGQVDATIAAFEATMPQVHAEDGCELYALHRSGDDLVMIEKWSSAEALAAHQQGPTMQALGPSLRGLIASAPDVYPLDELPIGGPQGLY